MFKSNVANAAIFVVPVLAFCLWFIPSYGVWQAELTGKAAQIRAEQENQIQIEQAKAELESAKLRAEAIAIVGEASQQFPGYRTQESTGEFEEAGKSVAVSQAVPTEADIPIVKSKSSSQNTANPMSPYKYEPTIEITPDRTRRYEYKPTIEITPDSSPMGRYNPAADGYYTGRYGNDTNSPSWLNHRLTSESDYGSGNAAKTPAKPSAPRGYTPPPPVNRFGQATDPSITAPRPRAFETQQPPARPAAPRAYYTPPGQFRFDRNPNRTDTAP
jgi:hypothetical protein